MSDFSDDDNDGFQFFDDDNDDRDFDFRAFDSDDDAFIETAPRVYNTTSSILATLLAKEFPYHDLDGPIPFQRDDPPYGWAVESLLQGRAGSEFLAP